MSSEGPDAHLHAVRRGSRGSEVVVHSEIVAEQVGRGMTRRHPTRAAGAPSNVHALEKLGELIVGVVELRSLVPAPKELHPEQDEDEDDKAEQNCKIAHRVDRLREGGEDLGGGEARRYE